MGLEKAIEHGKEHRKPYRGLAAYDTWCRNHGPCIYCVNNRLYQRKKEIEKANDKMKEALEEISFHQEV